MAKKTIKVAWFPSDTPKDTVLSKNGKALDNFCTKSNVVEDLGNYVGDMAFTIDALEYLNEEDILKVRLDYGDEIFRISKVTKGTKYIDIVVRQITIPETLTLYLEDVRPTNTNGQGALSHLLTNATGVKEITLQSDITAINTAYYEDTSLYKALQDGDNSFLTRWGGEILRRGYTISINSHIGIDRGVSIRERKNLTGFSGESNIDNLVTRARGKGYNGLKGNWIDSPIKNNYARVYTQTIEYQDVKVKTDSDTEGFETEALAKTELDRRVALEFSNNGIDKLKATYTINFVQLEKTEEYKNYVVAERTYLGDTVRVYVPKLKTDIKVRVISRKYNVLSQKVEEITLSSVAEVQAISASNIIADLKKQYNQTGNPNISSYIDAIIKSGMKDSYIVVRDNELLAMDTKDINTATKVARFNKEGLGFSSTGYYGTYTYGFTLDGVINASLIATGILSTILIQNADGSFKIDLSGTGGASFFNNGKKAMEMSSNALKLYNWAKEGDYIGSLGALIRGDDPNKPIIGLWNDLDSAIGITYAVAGTNSLGTYAEFDKYNIIGTGKPVRFKEEVEFNNTYSDSYRGKDGNVNLQGNTLWFTPEGGGGSPFRVDSNGNANFGGKITCNALDVMSVDKHRVIETSQGKVGINSLETPEVMNEDVYRGRLDESGECVIKIKEDFKECIETDDYDVFPTKYGKGEIWVQERNLDSFLVCGTPNLEFACRLIAIQKGCKGIRLKKIED
ncbi:phage tail spike protein [Clostridium sp. HBUAS56017]|uniref:phage tail spike protein n=1 Tax=Clostridium sp. HBUAS56017 TaxID=2571128 RepID=UPI0011781BA0|nr:phage tail spike protein [Clostridium sp. HBUAS56017]